MFSTEREKKGYESPESRVYAVMVEQNFCSVDAQQLDVNDFERVDEEIGD